MEIKTKKCSRCGKVLPLSEFHRNKAKPDGHSNLCKDCQNEYNREYLMKKTNAKDAATKEEKTETSSLFNDAIQGFADKMAKRNADISKIEVKCPVTLKDFSPREIIKHLHNLGYRIVGKDWKLVCIVEQTVNLKDIING